MSADTTPISPARFSAALKELSIEMLRLKVLEIRNSIAHLQYSNDQLKPFAEGTVSVTSNSSIPSDAPGSVNSTSDTVVEPDQDCIDAIKENEQVIERMAERIALVRIEVEERGVSWHEFQSKEEVEEQERARREQEGSASIVNGNGTGPDESPPQHSAWTDGTFQTGTIRNGEVHFDPPQERAPTQGGSQGGTLSDEQLRRALEERMRDLSQDDDEADGGMHL